MSIIKVDYGELAGGGISSGLVILSGMRNTDYSNPQICANVSNIDKVNIECSANSSIYGVDDSGNMTQLATGLKTFNNLDVSDYNRIAWLCTSSGNQIVSITIV